MTLDEYIESAVNKPMVWGEDDCVMWAAKWWEIATGEALNLPKYNSEDEANRMIDEAGGLVPLIASQIGDPEFGDPKSDIEPGDIVVIETSKNDVTTIALRGNVVAWRALVNCRIFWPRPRFVKAFWRP